LQGSQIKTQKIEKRTIANAECMFIETNHNKRLNECQLLANILHLKDLIEQLMAEKENLEQQIKSAI